MSGDRPNTTMSNSSLDREHGHLSSSRNTVCQTACSSSLHTPQPLARNSINCSAEVGHLRLGVGEFFYLFFSAMQMKSCRRQATERVVGWEVESGSVVSMLEDSKRSKRS